MCQHLQSFLELLGSDTINSTPARWVPIGYQLRCLPGWQLFVYVFAACHSILTVTLYEHSEPVQSIDRNIAP